MSYTEHTLRCESSSLSEFPDNPDFQQKFCWLKRSFDYYQEAEVTYIFPICNICQDSEKCNYNRYNLAKSESIHSMCEEEREPLKLPMCQICKIPVYHVIESKQCPECTPPQQSFRRKLARFRKPNKKILISRRGSRYIYTC